VISITYISSATTPFARKDYLNLLQQCRANNTRFGVTGMLLHKDGNFMQVLEGEPVAVNRIFRSIGVDPRHSGVVKINEHTIESRLFHEWPMAFYNLDNSDPGEFPAFPDLLRLSLRSANLQANPGRVEDLFLTCRNKL